MSNEVMTVAAANERIQAGRLLVIAGAEEQLARLKTGNWIGGTTAYFMEETGGQVNQNDLFVTDLTDLATDFKLAAYDEAHILTTMLEDRYSNGFSYLLLPCYSNIHQTYALETRYASTLFDHPVMGWIAGVHLDEAGKKAPKVVLGTTGEVLDNHGVVLHVQLPPDQYAEVDIINPYDQDQGDVFEFHEDRFAASQCTINGAPADLAAYYQENNIDPALPMVADYSGTLINTSIRNTEDKDTVHFFAPVLRGVSYRLAQPMEDLYTAFSKKLPENTTGLVSACNCILNYVHIGMQDRSSGAIIGPFTFGEIAYVLVNQTMVLLSVRQR